MISLAKRSDGSICVDVGSSLPVCDASGPTIRRWCPWRTPDEAPDVYRNRFGRERAVGWKVAASRPASDEVILDTIDGLRDGLALLGVTVAWDAAYLTVPWPTCWCSWRLSDASALGATHAAWGDRPLLLGPVWR
jgi:hypothetical protein